MGFDVTRFSQSGLNTLAELTTSKTLKITQVITSVNTHSDSDLDESVAYWVSENTTDVESKIMSIGVTNGEARIVVSLNLAPSVLVTTNIKALVLIACTTQGGIDGDEVVLCGILDPNGIDVIYNNSGIKVSAKIALYFRFSNTSSITVQNAIAPDYALQSDLDRFVSCHALGSPYTGENQIIYGEKQFLNPQHFGSDYAGTASPQIIISTDNTNLKSSIVALTQPDESNPPVKQILTFHSAEENYKGEIHGCLSTNVNIIPDWDDAAADVNLGNSDAHFAEGYIDNIYCSNLDVNTGDHWGVSFKSLDNSITYATIKYSNASSSLDLTTTSGSQITINAVGANLNLSGNGIYLRADSRVSEDLTVDGTLTANIGQVTSLTTSTLTVNRNMTVWGDVNFRGRVDLNANIVATGITTNSLAFNTELGYGNSPFVPGDGLVKTGCIILAFIEIENTLGVSVSPMRAGDLLPASCNIYVADANGVQWNTHQSNYTPCYTQGRQLSNDGTKYRLLCDAYNGGNNWTPMGKFMCPIICVKGD